MNIFRTFSNRKEEIEKEKESVQALLKKKYELFSSILEINYKSLKVMGDMEEKAQGEFLFDKNYIESSVVELNKLLSDIINDLNALSNNKFVELFSRFNSINKQIDEILYIHHEIPKSDLTIPFDSLKSEDISIAGSKNSQLGELKSMDIPVPDGFAITAWAYKHFLDFNKLQYKITELLDKVDIKDAADLELISKEIRELVLKSEIPVDLVNEIRQSYFRLVEKTSNSLVSVRSSAIGEDTGLSFAGQYASYLCVTEYNLLESYLKVLASKFSPKAIYYLLSHSLTESLLAMSVGCVTMVNAAKSGVIYTLNPIHGEEDTLIINSVFGLGKSLVDGSVSPDVYKIDRQTGNILEKKISEKAIKLFIENNELVTSDVLPGLQMESSLDDNEIKQLASYALEIEKHYDAPQDIEWSIDVKGNVFILQTRPLRIIKTQSQKAQPDISKAKKLFEGGIIASPGAGAGKVFHVSSYSDISRIKEEVVLVSDNPFPGLITAMNKVSALLTKVGGVASHLVTIAREYRIPTIVSAEYADKLKNGQVITVDAVNGVIYEGRHNNIVEALQPEYDYFEDNPIFELMKRLMAKISHLNLVKNNDNFNIENCRTYHDILRFVHQKSMEEMFSGINKLKNKRILAKPLKSTIPLKMDIIYIDNMVPENNSKKYIKDDDFHSIPMQAFWNGALEIGWLSPPLPPNMKSFLSVVATDIKSQKAMELAEKSYAVLSRDFMILSLKTGYHFSTIEAMCSDRTSKNYIKMSFKDGGASFERRVRRIRLISDILNYLGFDVSTKGDFLEAILTYEISDSIRRHLDYLGRLTMLTRQIDIALYNDDIAEEYKEDIMEKLFK